MKKFTLLPVGECFEFQNEQYSKTGPLTATSLKTNQQRMIPRSAMVAPLQANDIAQPTEQKQAAPFTVDSEALRAAFEQYHVGCTEWLRLAENELSAETAGRIRQALEEARERFLNDLRLN